MTRTIWKRDAPARRGATDEEISSTEDLLNRKLPTAYVELLREQNGGRLLYDAFPTASPTARSKHHVPVDQLYGVGGGGLDDALYLVDEWGMDPRLVPFCGDGHTWICLEYSTDEEPLVVWIDNESEPHRVVLSRSFAEFIKGLIRGDHRYIFGIATIGKSREEVVGTLSRALDVILVPSFTAALSGSHSRWRDFDKSEAAYFVLEENDHEDFPEADDCSWILGCDIAHENLGELVAAIDHLDQVRVRLLHKPAPNE